ncbi:hypothetical protein DFJ74DRAFT_679673 [Hyaloraphidium curvatum]|nr:hypothetical protein DFJ74DRAFT_679673 [Hyaloraphidium curvatum]
MSTQPAVPSAVPPPAPMYFTQQKDTFRFLKGNVRGYKIKNWAPSLIGWAGVVGFAALWILEATPIARRDVFSQLPIIGGYWQKKLEDAEKKD